MNDPLHDALVAIFEAIAEREGKPIEEVVAEFVEGYERGRESDCPHNTTTSRKDETMTVYEVIDCYFRRFGLFATRAKAEEWAKENPLHYFVGIKKVLATPAENRYRIKEVSVA